MQLLVSWTNSFLIKCNKHFLLLFVSTHVSDFVSVVISCWCHWLWNWKMLSCNIQWYRWPHENFIL